MAGTTKILMAKVKTTSEHGHYPPDDGSGDAQMQGAISQRHKQCQAYGMVIEPAAEQT